MPSSITDRPYGLSSSVAVKAPCLWVSTAPNALSGLTGVLGGTPAEGDRVLVIGNTDPVSNGIYNASALAWKRTGDFDGANDCVQGTLVVVFYPNSAGLVYQLVTAAPIIGTTPLVFQSYSNLNPNVFIPRTLGEMLAGATIVNATLQPGNPERYAVNVSPGNTHMSAAFQMAYNSLVQGGGGVMDVGIGPFYMDAPINCTWAGQGGCPPVKVRFRAGAAQQLCGAVLHHNSHGFDCTGNDTIDLSDAIISTPIPAVTVPQTAILFARNNNYVSGTNGASLLNRANGLKIEGCFSVCPVYNFGSEQIQLSNGDFYNSATSANTATVIHTANNIAGLASAFTHDPFGNAVAIAGAAQSCTVISDIFNQHFNGGGTTTSDCVRLEGVQGYQSFGGWRDAPSGRSLLYVDQTNSPSNLCQVYALRAEHTGSPVRYGILFGAAPAARTNSGWTISGCRLEDSVNAIAAVDANTTLDGLTLDPVSEQSSLGLSIPGQIQGNSQLRVGGMVLNIGRIINSLVMGLPANWTFGSQNGNQLVNIQAGQVGGFGTPTGGAIVANFPGATATLVQTSETVAEILNILKANGQIAT